VLDHVQCSWYVAVVAGLPTCTPFFPSSRPHT
jgi:hypothetical protein